MTAGTLIADRYRLLEQLPAVPPRVLWRARDEWSGQLTVATRVPMPGLTAREILVARYDLSREVRTTQGHRHRHIVQPTDAVLDADDLWVVAAPGPQASLAELLAERGRVEPEQAARWGHDIADALAAAHGVGVLHRDLHAGVVGLAEDGAAVLNGFAATVVTRDGLLEGIPVHVAPELARGAAPAPASDVFALGAVLYRAVEGGGPLPDTGDRAQALQLAAAGAVPPPQRAGQLSHLLVAMLHPDPSKRPPATAVRDQLTQVTSDQATRPMSWPPALPRLGLPPLGLPPLGAVPPARPAGGGGKRRRSIMVGGAVLGVLTLAGGFVVALMTLGQSTQPGRPVPAALPSASATPPAPRTVISDQQAVDPCVLLNVESVTPFGQATLVGDFAEFESCHINILTGDNGSVLLSAEFATPTDEPLTGAVEKAGDLTVRREPAESDYCYRTIILPDRYLVYVHADTFDGTVADLCGIADAATATAISALTGVTLANRSTMEPPNSLRHVDACSLLNAAALAQVPEIDSSHRDPGFGGWSCEWGYNPAFDAPQYAHIEFWRNTPLSDQPTQIAGRSAVVKPGGFAERPGTCVVRIVHRDYAAESGQRRVETVDIGVFLGAQQTTEAACQAATTLAAAIALKLPPAS